MNIESGGMDDTGKGGGDAAKNDNDSGLDLVSLGRDASDASRDVGKVHDALRDAISAAGKIATGLTSTVKNLFQRTNNDPQAQQQFVTVGQTMIQFLAEQDMRTEPKLGKTSSQFVGAAFEQGIKESA